MRLAKLFFGCDMFQNHNYNSRKKLVKINPKNKTNVYNKQHNSNQVLFFCFSEELAKLVREPLALSLLLLSCCLIFALKSARLSSVPEAPLPPLPRAICRAPARLQGRSRRRGSGPPRRAAAGSICICIYIYIYIHTYIN